MTHEGFYERFFIDPFIKKYSDFKGSTPRKEAMYALLTWVVITAGITGILTGLVGLIGREVALPCLWIISGLWILSSIMPISALASRAARYNAEGNAMATGVAERISDNTEKKGYRILGIDILLTVVCFLFLILGIPMMVTTLRSETVEIDPTGIGKIPSNPIASDSVYEEPIFNYQQTDISDLPIEAEIKEETPADTVKHEEKPVEVPVESPDSLAF